MKLPRDFSGRELAQVLIKNLGYTIIHEKGSHLVLQTDTPSRQRIVIPDHKALRIGTLNAIIREVSIHKGRDRAEIASLLL